MDESEEWHQYVVRMMDGVSFTVEFQSGTDKARITGPVGWVDDELEVDEGTYKEIDAEARRLIDRAVDTGRCSKHANGGAGGELKRNLTTARQLAKMGPVHPLRRYWTFDGPQ